MDSRIALGALGAAVVAALVWNAWTLTRLEARVAQLEAEGTLVHTQPPSEAPHEVEYRGTDREAEGPRGAIAAAPAAAWGPAGAAVVDEVVKSSEPEVVDLDDPKVREELEALVVETQERQWRERHEEFSRRWSDAVREEVEAFAAENDLDPKTTAGVISVLDDYRVAREAAHDDMRSGDLSMFEFRSEMQALREDAEADLRTLVGDQRFDALRDRVLPDRGPPH